MTKVSYFFFRILDSLLKRLEFVAVLYYRRGEDDGALEEAVNGLMSVKEEAMLNDIYFVLVSDQREFAKLGVEVHHKSLEYELGADNIETSKLV